MPAMNILQLAFSNKYVQLSVDWMVLYKPIYDFNHCTLPSGQATPSTLARDVACNEAAGY